MKLLLGVCFLWLIFHGVMFSVSENYSLFWDISVMEKENQSETAAAALTPCKKAKASKLKEAGQLEPNVELGTSFSKTPSSASNATGDSSKVWFYQNKFFLVFCPVVCFVSSISFPKPFIWRKRLERNYPKNVLNLKIPNCPISFGTVFFRYTKGLTSVEDVSNIEVMEYVTRMFLELTEFNNEHNKKQMRESAKLRQKVLEVFKPKGKVTGVSKADDVDEAASNDVEPVMLDGRNLMEFPICDDA